MHKPNILAIDKWCVDMIVVLVKLVRGNLFSHFFYQYYSQNFDYSFKKIHYINFISNLKSFIEKNNELVKTLTAHMLTCSQNTLLILFFILIFLLYFPSTYCCCSRLCVCFTTNPSPATDFIVEEKVKHFQVFFC